MCTTMGEGADYDGEMRTAIVRTMKGSGSDSNTAVGEVCTQKGRHVHVPGGRNTGG